MAGITCTAEEICTFAVCPPAPPNRPWQRRISLNSSTRNRGTPDSTRSCSHVCGRTRSRPWSTNTSPAPPTLTEVRLDAVTTAPCRAKRTLQPVFLCRSHFSRRPLEFPDGSRDISGYVGSAGQVAGHDPTITPLLHQVLPQHIPNRSRLWPQLVDSLINRLWVTDDVFFSFPSLSPHSWSVLWRVVTWDVPTVSAGRVPLPGAGLLEGQTPRWRAHHYPRLHHDDWDPLQGGYTLIPLKIDPLHTENTVMYNDATNRYGHWSYEANAILSFNVWLDFKKKTLKSKKTLDIGSNNWVR